VVRRVPSARTSDSMVMAMRRAHRLAQLAGDAALLAVVVAAQRVQAAEARRQRRLLLRELHRDVRRQEVPPVSARPLNSSISMKLERSP
jgi:hypothetical protein